MRDAQLVKIFLNFYGAQRSIMVLTTAQQYHSSYKPKVAFPRQEIFKNVDGQC